MEGIRRWFQGLSSSYSADHGDVSSNDAVERPPPSSASTGEEQRELVITVDLDMSGLKPIKVPMRTNQRVATMDHHKVSRTRITDCNPVVAQIIIYSLSLSPSSLSSLSPWFSDKIRSAFLGDYRAESVAITCLLLNWFYVINFNIFRLPFFLSLMTLSLSLYFFFFTFIFFLTFFPLIITVVADRS